MLWERHSVALTARVQEDGHLGCKPLKHVQGRPLRLWELDQRAFGRLSTEVYSPHPHAHTCTAGLTPLDRSQHTGKEQAATSWPKEPLKLWEPAPLCSCDPSAPHTAWPASFSGEVQAPLTRKVGSGLRPGSSAPTGAPWARPRGTPSPRTRHPCGRAGAPCPHRPSPSPPSRSASQAQRTAPDCPPGNNHPLRKAAKLGARNGRDGGGAGGGGL